MNILQAKHSSQGITLVEVIISLGLLSLLLVSLSGIFAASLEVQMRTQASNSRQEDAQYVLSRLFYDVNQASAISTPATLNQTTSSLVLTIGGNPWTYALSNGNLTLTNPSGTFQMNSYLTTVDTFSVTRVGTAGGTASVRINIVVGSRIEGAAGNGPLSYTTTYTVW